MELMELFGIFKVILWYCQESTVKRTDDSFNV
nr:MAG TPA: hypothetical protein [Caudoviricetes sp.]